MPLPTHAAAALPLFLLAAPASAQAALDDAVLVPVDGALHGSPTQSVAADGDRMIVGAEGFFAQVGSGAAYIFERDASGRWSEVATLLPPPGEVALYRFGRSVDIDGERAVVGSNRATDSPPALGKVFVYERRSGAWQFADSIEVDTPFFSESATEVSLEGDTLLIGAYTIGDHCAGSGKAFVYRHEVGTGWGLQTDLGFECIDDFFGSAVSLGGDRLIVGARLDYACCGSSGSGSANVFRLEDDEWVLEDEFYAHDVHSFGDAVSIQGERALVGASSYAAVWELQPGGDWAQVALLQPEGGVQLGFGSEVRLDGDRAFVANWGYDSEVAGAGAVFVFERQPSGAWIEVVRMESSASLPSNFAAEIAVSDDRLFATVPGDVTVPEGGSVRVFEMGPLLHGSPSVTSAGGGTQDLLLRAGHEHAGHAYVMLGSLSGTAPGTPVPGTSFALPLNQDAYTNALLALGGAGLVAPFTGVLDSFGRADSAVSLPPGLPPTLVGLVFHHAYVAFTPGPPVTYELASNAVALEIVP